MSTEYFLIGLLTGLGTFVAFVLGLMLAKRVVSTGENKNGN